MNYVTSLIAPDLLGYRHGLRQPAQTIRLRLGPLLPNKGLSTDWRAADAWLAQHFEVLAIARPAGPPEPDANADSALHVACLVMQLAATFLRAGGVPVFDPGRVLSLHVDKDSHTYWMVEAAIAQVDYFPSSATVSAFEAASIVVHELVARPHDFSDVQALYQQLNAALIEPLRSETRTTPATMVLLRCAWQSGVPWRHEGSGMYRLGWGAKSQLFQGSRSAADSSLAADVASNKLLTAQWLRRAGLPAPVHHLAQDFEHGLQAAQSLGWPVVVKPLQGARGEGLSVDVHNATDLKAAYARAAAVEESVLVERQVPGHCHRLLVVRGKVLYVVKRLPAAVQGDGVQTVRQLIGQHNEILLQRAPWKRPPALPVDDLAEQCLRAVGLSIDAVPTKGVWAPLRKIESTADGGRDEDMMQHLHPDNAALACRAAAVLGLDIAGVDVMSADLRVAWHQNGAIINEVNAAPALGASQMSLDAMPTMLSHLIDQQGRIPIEAYLGERDALERARARQREHCVAGLACYLVAPTGCESPDGAPYPMTLADPFRRVRALLMDRSVQAIVVVLKPGGWDSTGLPVDRMDIIQR